MQSYQCPHCGSNQAPVSKVVWSQKDKLLAAVLLILLFPAGLIFVIIKLTGKKEPVCPDCGKPYAATGASGGDIDLKRVGTTLKAAAQDPGVRKSVKDLSHTVSEGVSAMQDSMDVY